MASVRSKWAVGLVMIAACGGPPPAPVPASDGAGSRERPRTAPQPVVEQEFGSIEPSDVERRVKQLGPKLEACHEAARMRLPWLSGDIKLFFRVGRDGKVRYHRVEESTLGDRELEECLEGVISTADWPKPIGGDAEVRQSFGWPSGSERPPVAWGPEKVTTAIERDAGVKRAVAACKAGVEGEFALTAYVQPGDADDGPEASAHADGASSKFAGKPSKAHKKADSRGHFRSIGIAVSNQKADERADCILQAVRALALPHPGADVVKVKFYL